MTEATAATFVQRPMRLARIILGVTGTLLILVGALLLIRAWRNPDLARLEGWQQWFGAPLVVTSEWPERATAIGAAAALLLGCVAVATAGILAWWVRTRQVKIPEHELSVEWASMEAELERCAVSNEAAWVFWQSLREPTRRFSRLSETVEFGSRSIRVSSSITVRSDDLLEDASYAVPIALFSRGRLENGLRFSQGDRISSLSHIESAAYATAVVGRLVRAAGRRAQAQFVHEPQGYESLKRRVVGVMCSTVAGGATSAQEVARAVATLPAPARKQLLLYAAATVVTYLAEQYPVCVRVHGGAESNRVLIERTLIPSLRQYRHRVRGVRSRLEVFRKRVIDIQRSMFGIPIHSIDFPTQWAGRAASYHLNVRGPEGFYLSHQELRDGATGGYTLRAQQLESLTYAMTPRRGQRTGHLYVREGQRFANLLYSCSFYERMPGSMSTAFVGAITTTLVAVAVAWSVLFGSDDGVSGLLQILLAFPLALTATSSFKTGAPFWGGDLSARWATVVTLLVLTASLLASTVGTGSTREQQVVYWASILVVSSVNTILCGVSWISRAATYHTFLGR